MRLIIANVRIPEERQGDLTAQLGAVRTGQERLLEIVERYGFKEADEYARHFTDVWTTILIGRDASRWASVFPCFQEL